MKTSAEIIEALRNYPPDLNWYVILDEDEGFMLISEYTGNISDAQGCIVIGEEE